MLLFPGTPGKYRTHILPEHSITFKKESFLGCQLHCVLDDGSNRVQRNQKRDSPRKR